MHVSKEFPITKSTGRVLHMAQKPTAKKTVAEDPRYTQALQSYETGLRAMQEHKFDKAKPHFQKVIAGPIKELVDRANIHERDSVVKMLLGTFKLRSRGAFHVLAADAEMDVGPIRQFLARSANDVLKMRIRIVELVLLHGAQARFVVLHTLCKRWILCTRLFGRCLLGHL